LAGSVAGWVMIHRSSNRKRNAWVVSLLDVQPTDRVLEIGFGPGLAIEALSRFATSGKVYGIDHSPVMVRVATRRNRSAIRAGRVDLRVASADRLPAFDEQLDVALMVNALGFVRDRDACLSEIRRRLRPGGTIAIASQPRCPGATRATAEAAAWDLEAALAAAGFRGMCREMLQLEPPVVCVLGSAR
jgi:ubiquinone/menaquinone biosynthesis C-methylase UbiE